MATRVAALIGACLRPWGRADDEFFAIGGLATSVSGHARLPDAGKDKRRKTGVTRLCVF